MESRQFRLKKVKSQIRLFLPLGLLLISVALIMLGQFDSPYLNQFQMTVQETVAPIVRGVSAPIRWSKTAWTACGNFVQTYHQNQKLRAENEGLKNWRNLAWQLERDQRGLKEALNYIPPQSASFVTGNVLTDNGGRFVRSLIVGVGTAGGVSKGDVAMTSAGVLGRVVAVGENVSRLMLLTDYASRVPVSVGENRVPAILSGDGSDYPKIIALPENKTVSAGDVVLSSGQVGVFPAGLGIGIVEVVETGDIKVRLFEETIPDFVRLVNFGLNDVLLADECAAEAP